MLEPVLLSVVGGLILGSVAALICGLALRYFGETLSGGLDVDLYYAELDELKRLPDAENEVGSTSASLRNLLLRYGIGVSVVMMLVLYIVQFLPLTLPMSVLAVLVLWLAVGGIPLGLMLAFKMKQIVMLEMASVLERVVRSDEDEEWSIRASKAVFGGDLFGEDQEDSLELHLSRTGVAPVTLGLSGHVLIADNGLERTVSKSALRQLRLVGWLVDELSPTEADFKHEWSLHDSTYADIARGISRIITSMGFNLRNVRIRKASFTDAAASASVSQQAEKAHLAH